LDGDWLRAGAAGTLAFPLDRNEVKQPGDPKAI